MTTHGFRTPIAAALSTPTLGFGYHPCLKDVHEVDEIFVQCVEQFWRYRGEPSWNHLINYGPPIAFSEESRAEIAQTLHELRTRDVWGWRASTLRKENIPNFIPSLRIVTNSVSITMVADMVP